MVHDRFRPTILTWRDLDFEGWPQFPDLRLLAEGDSWFTLSGVPAYNLLFELRFPKPTCIVNCGQPGDTIRHMAELCRNRALREALGKEGWRWDAILLSGGGNDLIDEADRLIRDKNQRDPATIQGPADYCDAQRLQDLIGEIQAGFRTIAALRDAPDSPAPGAPILAHTYDYATPRNAPARFILAKLGPWLHPALTRSEVPASAWVGVADYLIDTLAQGLLALQTGPTPIANFRVVDTRNSLQRAELGHPGVSNDWQNEIHPNGDGYEKLARRWEVELRDLVAARAPDGHR